MSSSDNTAENVLRLADFWPYQITVLSDRIARRTSRSVKEEGLNLSQWRVMAAIAEAPGRTSVEVVTVTPMDKGLVSRATKALLTMGHVRREASQSDGRLSHLYLTSKGVQLYRRLLPLVKAVLEGAETQLSEKEQRRLSEQLQELIRVIPDLR